MSSASLLHVPEKQVDAMIRLSSARNLPPRGSVRAGLIFIFLFFAIGGVFHFMRTELEMSIVPPWIPDARAAVLASGVCELLGAAGLLVPRFRAPVLWGLFALVIAVTPCHIYMLQYPERFPAAPYWALVARIPLQGLLLWLIAWTALQSASGMGTRANSARH